MIERTIHPVVCNFHVTIFPANFCWYDQTFSSRNTGRKGALRDHRHGDGVGSDAPRR